MDTDTITTVKRVECAYISRTQFDILLPKAQMIYSYEQLVQLDTYLLWNY